ncbi:MAG: nuclear transport factor 2 family protein [Methanoculleus sp.]|nr:nuclear transport factor 2 family protein [Methanoculleus sp.]
MQVSEQTQNQIMAVLRQMAEATAEKNLDAMKALTDPDFQAFGTNSDEKVFSREAYLRHLEQDFSQAETIALEFCDIHIGAEGTVAWVMGGMTYNIVADGALQTLNGRLTAVLRGTGHAWVFVQLHYSLPAEDQGPTA